MIYWWVVKELEKLKIVLWFYKNKKNIINKYKGNRWALMNK